MDSVHILDATENATNETDVNLVMVAIKNGWRDITRMFSLRNKNVISDWGPKSGRFKMHMQQMNYNERNLFWTHIKHLPVISRAFWI